MSRDEIYDSAADRKHSDRVNHDAEHEHSKEYRDSLKIPVERGIEDPRYRRDGANHRKRAENETDDKKRINHLKALIVKVLRDKIKIVY